MPLELESKNHFDVIQCLILELKKAGVDWVILCPGSRSAPLAIGVLESKLFQTKVVLDERVAGFIALGISKSTHKPVAVITTSGTAVNNLSPACSEAYFSHTPLIFLTGDRPARWIGQQDNQAIYQEDIFYKNIGKSIPLQTDKILNNQELIENQKIQIKNGFNFLMENKLPIHFNFPFEEPFYPKQQDFKKFKDLYIPQIEENEKHNPNLEILKDLNPDTTFIAIGFNHFEYAPELLNQGFQCIIIADGLSNFPFSENYIPFMDINSFWINFHFKTLITYGNGFTNKSFKNAIRKYSLNQHFHISEDGASVDTFEKGAVPIQGSLNDLMSFLKDFKVSESLYQDFRNYLKSIKSKYELFRKEYFREIYCESDVLHQLINIKGIDFIHLGNSTVVRHFTQFPIKMEGVQIHCNRGTSGIDGSISTAIGIAIAHPDKFNLLILGDQSFQYDCSGLFNAVGINNLGIVIFNNHGGNIFSLIEGSSESDYLDYYFRNAHQLNFEHIALQHHFRYVSIKNEDEFLAFQLILNQQGITYLSNTIVEMDFDKSSMDLNEYSNLFKEFKVS